MAENKFRPAKTLEQEEKFVGSAILKSTQYKNQWVVGILEKMAKSQSS